MFGIYSKIRKGKNFAKKLKGMDLSQFVYYNYISKQIMRKKGKYLFPYKGSCITLDKGSTVFLKGDLYLNDDKHPKSHEETYFHICEGGSLSIEGETRIFANSTVKILNKAVVTIGQMNSNYGLTLICQKNMNIGNEIELGRNVTLYDSNFHSTSFNPNMNVRPLNIGNHVWLCTGVTIAKGLTIGDGAICGINSTITRNVPPATMVLGNPAKVTMENVSW